MEKKESNASNPPRNVKTEEARRAISFCASLLMHTKLLTPAFLFMYYFLTHFFFICQKNNNREKLQMIISPFLLSCDQSFGRMCTGNLANIYSFSRPIQS